MSLAAALPDERIPAPQPHESYAELARSLVLHRPDLFAHAGRGGGFAIDARGSPVQSIPRRVALTRPRRRGGRQLALPLASPPAGMLR